VIFLVIKQILNDDVVSIASEVLRSKFFFSEGTLIKFDFFDICPFMDLLVVDTEVFESLHMSCCEIKLISTLILIGGIKTFGID
jgi:hypothetical protein